ncbi:MAG: DUF763 domain-containing protein [Planctomycetaceae bacterium]|nr:DUF763 domain-containing protein [Planctomycetaceae bacterium]MCB9954127.1 DUF763 domain-containing protein [Planctomycetaceae bacterium]
MQRRVAHLPLHGGKAPKWLFKRMVKLAGAITESIVDQFGPDEMLNRLSDPWWFQAFGCVLGFDWHSSGVTTVTCGALKEAYKERGADLGIIVAGGKGATSRKTPQELADASDQFGISQGDRLIYASRMSAKVDSAAVQDGFGIYHHSFFLTPGGAWCVVQQGMSDAEKMARRYHWLGNNQLDFVCEPHAAIQNVDRPKSSAKLRKAETLNMVAAEAGANRDGSAALVREHPDKLMREVERLTVGPTLFAPTRHKVLDIDVNRKRLRQIVIQAHEQNPQDFETLLGVEGVGPATVRSLSLIAEVIFNSPASRRDPLEHPVEASGNEQQRRWADYSYAHGGKDGTPFPVTTDVYDENIDVLERAIKHAKLGDHDRIEALKRLGQGRGPLS